MQKSLFNVYPNRNFFIHIYIYFFHFYLVLLQYFDSLDTLCYGPCQKDQIKQQGRDF